MKQTLMKSILIVAVALALPLALNARQLSLTAVVQKNNLSLAEAAAAIAIAKAFNLDAQIVVNTGRRLHTPIYDLGPTYWFSDKYGADFDRVWEARRKGKGWGVIAQELGIHPGTFNKMRKAGEFDRYTWDEILRRRYGDWATSDFDRYRRDGYSQREIIVAMVQSDGRRPVFESKVRALRDVRSKVRKSSVVNHKSNSGKPNKLKAVDLNKARNKGKSKSPGEHWDRGDAKGKQSHGKVDHGSGKSKGGGKGKGKG